MGSFQSAPDSGAKIADAKKEEATFDPSDNPKGLSGMPLVHHVCRKRKATYDKCVRNWYSRQFITGQGTLSQEEVCGEKFERYRRCILKGIRKEVWEKEGYPPPGVNSPLLEVMDDDDDDNNRNKVNGEKR
jgi:Uncharacterised protein family (UPF0203)